MHLYNIFYTEAAEGNKRCLVHLHLTLGIVQNCTLHRKVQPNMYPYRVIEIEPKSFSFFLVFKSSGNWWSLDDVSSQKNSTKGKYMNEWVGGKESYPSGSQKYKVVALSGRPGY